jgi:ribonucleotide reductase alpha subunit
MPRVIEYFGYIFYFYAHDHLPIHVHVSKAGCETIFQLIYENGILTYIEERKSAEIKPLNEKQKKEALKVIKLHAEFITDSWTNFYARGIAPKTMKITKEI